MTKDEILAQLEDLVEDRESFRRRDPENDIWQKDIDAMEGAIRLIKGLRPAAPQARRPDAQTP